MQLWQKDQIAYWTRCALDDAPLAPITKGILTADVDRYLETRVGRPGYKADRSHLAAWVKVFGHRPRYKITAHDCEKQIGAWLKGDKEKKQAPLAIRTLRHRRRVLRELWHKLDGPHARTPVDDVKLQKPPKIAPIPVDDALILKVADSLLAGKRHAKGYGGSSDKTYARFLIRAISGQRPSQVGRATPEHLDREQHIWWVQPAKGGNAIPFPLIEELDLAFQLLDKAKAWGPFDTRSFSKTIKRHGWPENVKPYALRHSFAIKQLTAGTDLGDLQGLLGHTNPTTTRVYAPVLLLRLREAMQRRSNLNLVTPPSKRRA